MEVTLGLGTLALIILIAGLAGAIGMVILLGMLVRKRDTV